MLPSIVLVVLGVLATADAKTRKQWTDFLFSIGQLRADQREDAAKQASVKWPFFVFAVLWLWLPFTYLRSGVLNGNVGKDASAFTKAADEAEAISANMVEKTPTAPKPTGPTPPAAPDESARPMEPGAEKALVPETAAGTPHS